ncbi:hypothetical protein Hanom_Chr05g00443101 [Helianthus anomalus]
MHQQIITPENLHHWPALTQHYHLWLPIPTLPPSSHRHIRRHEVQLQPVNISCPPFFRILAWYLHNYHVHVPVLVVVGHRYFRT